VAGYDLTVLPDGRVVLRSRKRIIPHFL
jgi:hypothetical protein